MKHYYNAHFPGLYSIVLKERGDLLDRIYVAKPGELHPDLQHPDAPFLWHAHGYDFTETTIAGHCINYVLGPGDKFFNRYQIEAGIDTGREPKLKWVGFDRFNEYEREVCFAGESFYMNHEKIHRVTFHPDVNGWFACLVEEHKKVAPPELVYSPTIMDSAPNASELYKEISGAEAAIVLSKLSCAGYSW